MINIINRTDNAEGISSADSTYIRCWSPDLILREIDKLARMNVETLRIADEMFFLHPGHFEPLLKGLVERDHDLKLWSYARVDTIKKEHLKLFRQAGMRWLALGFESGNKQVRKEISKGKVDQADMIMISREIDNHGIHVAANYIFGLPDDDYATMRETYDLACEINAPFANFYTCMALPGSPLYLKAKENNWGLPDSYEGYGFLSYECLPLRTKYISATDVLRFRDDAWHKYHSRKDYLGLIERKFGVSQKTNLEELIKIKIERKLLGD
jgi:radical SAM superfamily enzyme YgiQ (UPF0313 family)